MRGLVLAVLLTTTTAATETLFDLFGVSQVELPGLDDSQLKKLYKRRALELHPDKSDHPDAEDITLRAHIAKVPHCPYSQV